MTHVQESNGAVCVYCEEPMEPRKDGIRSHPQCEARYGSYSPPPEFAVSEDGFARYMAWRAGAGGS